MIYPFKKFEEECKKLLIKAFEEENLIGDIILNIPPSSEYGELSFATFSIAKKYNKNPNEFAKIISSKIMNYERNLIERVESVSGYVNFFLNYGKFAKITIETILELGENYGKMNEKGIKIIIEHTSVNPIHPIHIGGARNAIIGDVLSNILKIAGYDVKRHFYIDDMGLQVSQAAYGFSKINQIQGKADHFIGFIYAITNCAINIKKLKEEINKIEDDEKRREKIRELDEWISIAFELRSKNEKIFDNIVQAIYNDENPENEINNLLRNYERKEENAIKLIRKMCELVISGFKETLSRIGVEFDSWDWESEITVWSGSTEFLIKKLMETEFGRIEKNTLILDCNAIIEKFSLREKYGIKTDIPPLILKRSDGTTLYTTRDIAYTIWKFQRADKVINVISLEQKLPQLQLKLALYALGFGNLADKLIHFSYELVHLPGIKMSGRRGRYVSLDEVLDEAIRRAYEEISKRSKELNEEERKKIAEAIGIGAVRYALISIASNKPITFTWERVLDFEKNSAPFIQYAHARASNILLKSREINGKINYEKLNTDYEKKLIIKLALFPRIIEIAANELRPELIAEYANELASIFNLFYDNVPVLKAEEELRNTRLKLVKAVKIVLKNALSIMGINALEKM
ncbi:MAG: arginine--tRNA ligase [Candidatus Methanomethylicaceae archaeon]